MAFVVILTLIAITTVILVACATGGRTNSGDAEGGKIQIPITVHQWEGPPMSAVCCTNVGSCFMGSTFPIGSPCYCTSYYGPIYGVVC